MFSPIFCTLDCSYFFKINISDYSQLKYSLYPKAGDLFDKAVGAAKEVAADHVKAN